MRGNRNPPAKVGFLGIGLAAYWPQFPGLRDRVDRHLREVGSRLETFGEVVFPGLADTESRSSEAGDLFAREGVDLVALCPGTYGTSSLVVPCLERVQAPVLLLNIPPERSLDYTRASTADFLANVGVCAVPEIAGLLTRWGRWYKTVTAHLDDADRLEEIGGWMEAAAAVRNLKRARIGWIGHVYPGMLDLHADLTGLLVELGVHVESIEPGEVAAAVEGAGPEEIERVIAETRRDFDLLSVPEEDLRYAAQVACGFERVVEERGLDALAFYWRGRGETLRVAAASGLATARLSARGVPVAGEGDLRTAVALKLLSLLESPSTFSEFYAVDFEEGFVIMGHDAPGNPAAAEGRAALKALEVLHGKAGRGVGLEFRVRFGPVTLLNVTSGRNGRVKLVVTAATSVPGPTLSIGNPNTRIQPALPVREFLDRWCDEGPSHHVALGVGDRRAKLRKVSALLGAEYAEV